MVAIQGFRGAHSTASIALETQREERGPTLINETQRS